MSVREGLKVIWGRSNGQFRKAWRLAWEGLLACLGNPGEWSGWTFGDGRFVELEREARHSACLLFDVSKLTSC